MQGLGMANRTKRVIIEHMRLDYKLAEPNSPERARIKELNRAIGRPAIKGDGEVGPSPLTAIRLRSSPIAWLISKQKIGGDEFRAAVDIETAFTAISGALMFKPLSMEKTSPGRRRDWNDKTSDAVERYRAFADHWSARKKQSGDKTLEILIAAVIDHRSFNVIEEDLSLRHGKAKTVTIRGLRDYAARAEWVDRRTAATWKQEAAQSFQSTERQLALAIAKARVS